MIILSLDPGRTTGWAVMSPSGPHDTGNFLPEDLVEGLRGVFEKWAPSEVVVETFPIRGLGPLQETLRDVMGIIHQVCMGEYGRPWHPITPGIWKTSSVAEAPKEFEGRKLTPHERDAIRMGTYWLKKQGKVRRA